LAAKALAAVINPTSAGGRSLILWPQFAQQLIADGYRLTSHVSESEVDFRECVRRYARRHSIIAVCGGDSSLTIAAEELLRCGFSGELRFLPAGSVNDIVLDLREQRSPKSVFLGEIEAAGNRKLFLGQANWGLGVVVNRWVGLVLRRFSFMRPLQNTIGMVCIMLAHILRREYVHAEIATDSENLSGRFSILVISQIRHWASGLRFCPGASYQMPEFEIVAVERTGLLKLLRTILKSKNAEHIGLPHVHVLRTRIVTVQLRDARAAQVDGDIMHSNNKELAAKIYSVKKQKTKFRISG
jgi:diacylglycerol kinase (ATP)